MPAGDCCTAGAECADDDASAAGGGAPVVVATAPSGPISCAIAPGAIGAAHQLGFSTGYRSDCEGTPAESSAYQWPLAWTADLEGHSLKYGSDVVQYSSHTKVWYRLDKNWKRSDTCLLYTSPSPRDS